VESILPHSMRIFGEKICVNSIFEYSKMCETLAKFSSKYFFFLLWKKKAFFPNIADGNAIFGKKIKIVNSVGEKLLFKVCITILRYSLKSN